GNSQGNRLLESCRLPTGERYVMARASDRVTAETIFPRGRFLHLSLPEIFFEGEYFLFGVETADNATRREADEEGDKKEGDSLSDKLCVPKDPGAEGLIIPGDPFILSERCEKRARNREVLGLTLFCVGLALNVFITFLILGLLPL
ncbi:MAG: hypothetical protein R6V67_10225, partial [Spirochaetia bacterium]